jgi:hypothetical protein
LPYNERIQSAQVANLVTGNPLQFSVLLKNTAGMHWIGELGFQDATIKSEFHVPRLQK